MLQKGSRSFCFHSSIRHYCHDATSKNGAHYQAFHILKWNQYTSVDLTVHYQLSCLQLAPVGNLGIWGTNAFCSWWMASFMADVDGCSPVCCLWLPVISRLEQLYFNFPHVDGWTSCEIQCTAAKLECLSFKYNGQPTVKLSSFCSESEYLWTRGWSLTRISST